MTDHLLIYAMLFGPLLYSFLWSEWHKVVAQQWVLMLMAVVCAGSVWVAKRTHWTLALAAAWTVVNALYVSAFSPNHFSSWGLVEKLAFQKTASYGGLTLVLLLSLFTAANRRQLTIFAGALTVLCLLGSAVVLLAAVSGVSPGNRGLIFGNASMHGCLLAVTYPFVLGRTRRLIVRAMPVLAIFLLDASIPVGTLAVVLACRLRAYWRYLLVVAGACLIAGLLLQGDRFLSSNGRLEVWNYAIPYWINNFNPWIGSGTGSAMLLLPKLNSDHAMNVHFLWLHSDWLQVMMEQGIVGVVLWALALLVAADKAWHSDVLFPALVGLCSYAAMNYPARLSLHAIVGSAIIAMAFSPACEAHVETDSRC